MKGIVLFILLVSVFYSGWQAWQHTAALDQHNHYLAEQGQVFKKIWLNVGSFLDWATLNKFGFAKDEVEKIKESQTAADSHYKMASVYTSIFVILSIVCGILSSYIAMRMTIFVLSLIAIVCLVIGVITPIITITAFNDFPVIGETILKFQSKSILTTIQTLFSTGNLLLGIIVLLFSVIIPAIKSIILLVISFIKDKYLSQQLNKIIGWIGKWSMVDVFVLALLVTIFVLQADKGTDASLMIGGYFFAAYALLSMAIPVFVTRS